jgi:hypothetical protein
MFYVGFFFLKSIEQVNMCCSSFSRGCSRVALRPLPREYFSRWRRTLSTNLAISSRAAIAPRHMLMHAMTRSAQSARLCCAGRSASVDSSVSSCGWRLKSYAGFRTMSFPRCVEVWSSFIGA